MRRGTTKQDRADVMGEAGVFQAHHRLGECDLGLVGGFIGEKRDAKGHEPCECCEDVVGNWFAFFAFIPLIRHQKNAHRDKNTDEKIT